MRDFLSSLFVFLFRNRVNRSHSTLSPGRLLICQEIVMNDKLTDKLHIKLNNSFKIIIIIIYIAHISKVQGTLLIDVIKM